MSIIDSLAELIQPYDAREFIRDYWSAKPLHIPGPTNRFRSIFDWEAYNQVLSTHLCTLRFPLLRMVVGGKVLPERSITEEVQTPREGMVKKLSFSKIKDHSSRGATLVVNAIDRLHPLLMQLSSNVARSFGQSVQINCYHSHPGVQGFDTHYDPHEIFILQIEGSKDWHLYGITCEAPLPHQRYFDAERPSNEPRVVTLEKGDVLYLPRGYWHSAVAARGESLHLTLGIYTHKKIDFVRWIVDRLEADPFLRSNMPVRLEAESQYEATDVEQIIDHVIRHLRNLGSESSELARSFDEVRVARTFEPYKMFDFPLSSPTISVQPQRTPLVEGLRTTEE